jgi:hypothetical protein
LPDLGRLSGKHGLHLSAKPPEQGVLCREETTTEEEAPFHGPVSAGLMFHRRYLLLSVYHICTKKWGLFFNKKSGKEDEKKEERRHNSPAENEG